MVPRERDHFRLQRDGRVSLVGEQCDGDAERTRGNATRERHQVPRDNSRAKLTRLEGANEVLRE